jgi:hypothetical protein
VEFQKIIDLIDVVSIPNDAKITQFKNKEDDEPYQVWRIDVDNTKYVLKEVDRAVTSHVSRGEYSHEERRTLTIICTPNESIKIKKFVAEVDPDAFATIMPISNVWGKRFADIREVDNL